MTKLACHLDLGMDPRNLGSVLHNPVDLSQKPCNGHKVSTPRAFGFRPKSRRLGTTTNPVSNVIAAAIHVRGFALRRDHHPVLDALFFLRNHPTHGLAASLLNPLLLILVSFEPDCR
jgi:hypothetical protein